MSQAQKCYLGVPYVYFEDTIFHETDSSYLIIINIIAEFSCILKTALFWNLLEQFWIPFLLYVESIQSTP